MIRTRRTPLIVALVCASAIAGGAVQASSATSLGVASNTLGVSSTSTCQTSSLQISATLGNLLKITNITPACQNRLMMIHLNGVAGSGADLSTTPTSSSVTLSLTPGLLGTLTGAKIVCDGWAVPTTWLGIFTN
jgi:hypothetical protein